MTIFETVRNEKMTSIQLNVNEKIFQNSSFPKNNFIILVEIMKIKKNRVRVLTTNKIIVNQVLKI